MPPDIGGAPAAPAAPAAAPTASAPPAAPAAPAAAPAAPSVLAAGAAAPAATGAAPAPPADPLGWLPEKHRVFGQDGKTLDLEASARKVAEAYGHAEKRIGSGDMPPKSAAEYKITVPEALADKIKAEDLAKDAGFTEFLGKAHAAGLTQKQVDTVVGEFLDRSLKLQGGVRQLSEQEATAKLRETWKTDAEFTEGVQRAFKAGQAYAGPDFEGILQDYGNDPRIVRLLANVGKELSEDTSAPAGAVANFTADLESLVKSPAYMNPNDPNHLATKQKVEALMQRQYGTGAKKPGPIVISAT